MLLEVRQETKFNFLFGTVILGTLSIFKKSQAWSPYEALNSVCLEGVRGCEAPCPDEAETYGFLYGLHWGFRHAFIL